MNRYTHNGKTYFCEAFKTSNGHPLILISQKEVPHEGLFKVYFLHKYSIKFAMDDFCKYEDLVASKKTGSSEMLPV